MMMPLPNIKMPALFSASKKSVSSCKKRIIGNENETNIFVPDGGNEELKASNSLAARKSGPKKGSMRKPCKTRQNSLWSEVLRFGVVYYRREGIH